MGTIFVIQSDISVCPG